MIEEIWLASQARVLYCALDEPGTGDRDAGDCTDFHRSHGITFPELVGEWVGDRGQPIVGADGR
jgi:hypothetical protein